jgi:hypothetical protein
MLLIWHWVHTFYGKVILSVDLVVWYIVSDSMHRSSDADYRLLTVYRYDMDINEDCMKQEIRFLKKFLLFAVDMTEQQIRLHSPYFFTWTHSRILLFPRVSGQSSFTSYEINAALLLMETISPDSKRSNQANWPDKTCAHSASRIWWQLRSEMLTCSDWLYIAPKRWI